MPTAEELRRVCEDYFGDMATEVRVVGGEGHAPQRVEVELRGVTSVHPRIDGVGSLAPTAGSPRRVVVWRHNDGAVDVLTRFQDAAVNAMADGLADVIARWWQGERDDHEPTALRAEVAALKSRVSQLSKAHETSLHLRGAETVRADKAEEEVAALKDELQQAKRRIPCG